MNKDLIDDIFNDEANNIKPEEVEAPSGYGRTIICKTTLVKNAKRLINEIAKDFKYPPFDIQVLDTTEDNVFVIAISRMGNVSKTLVKSLQDDLCATICRETASGGCIEIKVYRDVEIYTKEDRVVADECIYKPKTFSHEKPLDNSFADILTRQYDPTLEKTTIDFPQII
jgi:hypothetical protein